MLSHAQVQYILALKEHQNFQRAAKACFITQPTLSMQIKKAEETIGYALFNREKTPIELTSFGKILLPTIYQISDSYKAFEVQLKKIKGTYKAEVTLGIIPTIAAYLIPECYTAWQKELGEIKLDIVELKSETLIEQLKERKIDMGIMAGPLNEKTIQEHILFNEEILVYSPTSPSKEINVSELNTLRPWLLAEGNCLRTQMINFCNIKEDDTSEWSYEGSSIHILLEMVKAQGGYTLIPENYLNYTGISKDHFHRLGQFTPARQIIAIFNERSTKEEHAISIIRQIQRAKMSTSKALQQENLLPWR